jgi:hypothetical protein
MKLTYDDLKARHRSIRDSFQPALNLRTHRALSWLQRAERESADPDARSNFLWVSFNAAYANEIKDKQSFSERRVLLNFLGRLIDTDIDNLLYLLVWEHFSASIRLLLDNRYVSQPFWDFQNSWIAEEVWIEKFERSKRAAHRALGKMQTRKVMAVLLDRLYVLRNQLVHGGATWNSRVNRRQVQDGAEILGVIVPTVIHLMMEAPEVIWGDPNYPVVE